MKKKKLLIFIELFNSLDAAASLLYEPKKVSDDEFLVSLYATLKVMRTESVEKSYLETNNQPSPDDTGLSFDLISEIEENLYAFPDRRIIYIKYILRQFFNISPYLYQKISKKVDPIQKASSFFVSEFIYANMDYDKISNPEKYLVNCWQILGLFFNSFDALCLNFNIDLMEIQKEMNITVYPIRAKNVLNRLGYEEILKKLNSSNGPDKVNNKKVRNKLISFNGPETIEKLFEELKGYFPGSDKELRKALNGEKIPDPLLFPHNGNRFVEVFRRLNYNGKLLNKYTEIRDWICLNFAFCNKNESKKFIPDTVYDILKGNSEPTKQQRILKNVDWLPYKTKEAIKLEKQKEEMLK